MQRWAAGCQNRNLQKIGKNTIVGRPRKKPRIADDSDDEHGSVNDFPKLVLLLPRARELHVNLKKLVAKDDLLGCNFVKRQMDTLRCDLAKMDRLCQCCYIEKPSFSVQVATGDRWKGIVCPKCFWGWEGREIKFREQMQVATVSLQMRASQCMLIAKECLEYFKKVPTIGQGKAKELTPKQKKKSLRKLAKLKKKVWPSKMVAGQGIRAKEGIPPMAAISYIERCMRRLSLEPDLQDCYNAVRTVLEILQACWEQNLRSRVGMNFWCG